MAFDINKKGIEFNHIDSKKYISSLEEIINNNKNIYIIESVSGREKDIEKDYKVRKVIIKNNNIFDYDSSEKIKYINKNEINNLINKSYIYFLSRGAFIEYYNILYNKKIENEKYIKKIKDRIKQSKYIQFIFPAYKLKSKEKNKEGYFYTLDQTELFDMIIEYFELEIGKLKDILYSENKYYYNIINAKIICLYKKIQNYISKDYEKLIYYDYKLYFMPFNIFYNFKQGRITETEYNNLMKLYRNTYKSFKKNQKKEKEYMYLGYKLENNETYYKNDLLKIFESIQYEDYKINSFLEEYIELNKKLIDYQIKHNRYIKNYNDFFKNKILIFLYFTNLITKDDFLFFEEKIKELEETKDKKNQSISKLNKRDEDVIYEIIIKNNYQKAAIGYIELYNFTKHYYKNFKEQYIRNIELISKYYIFKKILK